MTEVRPLGPGLAAAAFVWGFAEATVFFVVPDVLLSIVAQRRGGRAALAAVLPTTLGAVLGGVLMWQLGSRYPGALADLVDRAPAISAGMIADAGRALSEGPLAAMLAGAFSGVPYKVFAITAPAAGVSVPVFALLSLPTRAARFVLVVGATSIIDRVAGHYVSGEVRSLLLIGFWVLFYGLFWTLMPG